MIQYFRNLQTKMDGTHFQMQLVHYAGYKSNIQFYSLLHLSIPLLKKIFQKYLNCTWFVQSIWVYLHNIVWQYRTTTLTIQQNCNYVN